MQRSFIAADPHICCRSLLASWFFQRCGGRRFLHDSLFGLLGLAARRSILGQTIWRRQSMRHTLRQVTITTQPQLERSTQPFQATVSLPKKNIRKKVLTRLETCAPALHLPFDLPCLQSGLHQLARKSRAWSTCACSGPSGDQTPHSAAGRIPA